MFVLAPSLVDLRSEIDARWPNRSRRIDGWYRPRGQGDPSDHWPDDKGMVHAIDIDKNGIVPMAVVEACSHHKSVCHYVIWNRQIYSAIRNFVPIDYHGKNPHIDHVHVSGQLTSLAENYRGGWGIARGAGEGTNVPPEAHEGFGVAFDFSTGFDLSRNVNEDLAASMDAVANTLRRLRT
jgi:hypothetical protein